MFPGQRQDLMIDMETGGTTPGSKIYSIGACIFEPYAKSPAELIKELFYINIDPATQPGLVEDPATLKWWSKQSPEARAALEHDQEPLSIALQRLLKWMSRHPIGHYWANSPSFDICILKAALATQALEWPLPFWNERCVRTIKSIAFPNGAPKIKIGTAHNAVADAAKQAIEVWHCYNKLVVK